MLGEAQLCVGITRFCRPSIRAGGGERTLRVRPEGRKRGFRCHRPRPFKIGMPVLDHTGFRNRRAFTGFRPGLTSQGTTLIIERRMESGHECGIRNPVGADPEGPAANIHT